MKQFKLQIGLTIVSVLAVSTLAIGPVSAERGRGENGEIRDKTVTTATTTETETETEAPSDRVDELRSQAKKLLAEERQAKKQASTTAKRQKACEARKANLTRKVTNFSAQAERHLVKLDRTYDKLKAYQTEKKLDAADYDALVATADANKVTATAAVSALKEVTVEIDCTSEDPAASVATFKTAVSNARGALHDYRHSIKKVLVSLMTAKNTASDDSTEDTTDITETKPTEGTN